MTERKKKFEACLLRITADEFVVAEWHQVVSTNDKTKLTIGSSVGYKTSTNKREKAIRGTIVVIGSTRLCQQQMKLFMGKINKKKVQAKEFDSNDEEESADVPDNKDPSDSNDEQSSESSDECLHIDAQEETSDANGPKRGQIEELKPADVKRKSQTNKSNKAATNVADSEEQTNSSYSCKRMSSDTDVKSPAPKRSMGSLARIDEYKMENNRLKNQVDKYMKEWMPRPTDPSVIRYFIRMGELFSSNGEDEVGKGDKLAIVCDNLNMNEEQLNRLQKANGTKTARAIVRACYPPSVRMGVDLENIEPGFRAAIHDYVQIFHGMEGLTEGKINESINNVFRSAKSQQREKNSKQQPLQSSINNSQNLNNQKISSSLDKENVCSNKK